MSDRPASPSHPILKYDEGCRLIAEARAIDEVKNLRDRAMGLRVYARQAKHRQLEIDAVEIRLRAERRIGEIMAEHRADGLIRPGAPAQTRAASTGFPAERITLKSIGVDERLGNRARTYAAMPASDFERRLVERRALVEGGASRVATDLVTVADKAARRATREADLAGRVRALPDRRYAVILADPEWRFDVWSRETGLDRAGGQPLSNEPHRSDRRARRRRNRRGRLRPVPVGDGADAAAGARAS